MAMIKCSECGNEISDQAMTCPNCGAATIAGNKHKKEEKKAKNNQRANTQGCGCLLIILGGIIGFFTGGLGGVLSIIGLVFLIYGLIMPRA